MYFIANILHVLAVLSKVFQNKFVDIIIIDSIVRTYIAQIKMLFIVKPTYSNIVTINKNIGIHVILEYGLLGGHLRKVSSEIH